MNTISNHLHTSNTFVEWLLVNPSLRGPYLPVMVVLLSLRDLMYALMREQAFHKGCYVEYIPGHNVATEH